MAKVPEEYLEGIEVRYFKKTEKYLAVDSTGYSTNKYESWFNVRTGEESKRREFKKSHMIVRYWYKGILSHEVTLGHHHDSSVFPILMGKLPSGDYDNMSGDTGYCSRDNCDLVSEKGMKPFFKPMKSATSKAKGSFPWHSMIRLWKDNPELFGREYHQRSVIYL